jgi:predicted enzyme related to lactoylglutathione lyase
MSVFGMFGWNELNTSDVAAARRFFEDALGWSIAEMPGGRGGYWIASAGGRQVAGIFDLKMHAITGVPDHWVGYVSVEDVDGRFAAAKAAGASVIREPFDIEGVARIAIVHMPGGAVLGLMTPVPGA